MPTTISIQTGPLTVSHTIQNDEQTQRALLAFARANEMPEDLTVKQQLEFVLMAMLHMVRAQAINTYRAEQKAAVAAASKAEMEFPLPVLAVTRAGG
jgi:hypothetical protein